DALALHGDADTLAIGLTAHLHAGADHVCVQAIDEDPMPTYGAIAQSMGLCGPWHDPDDQWCHLGCLFVRWRAQEPQLRGGDHRCLSPILRSMPRCWTGPRRASLPTRPST